MIEIRKDVLLEGLSKFKKIVKKNVGLNIYKAIQFRFNGSELTLLLNNGHIEISTKVYCLSHSCKDDFKDFMIDYYKLMEVLDTEKDNILKISIFYNGISINNKDISTCDCNNYNFEHKEKDNFNMASNELKKSISTLSCAYSNDSKFNKTTLYTMLDVKDDKISLYTTDGYRLVKSQNNIDSCINEKIFISNNTMKKIGSLLSSKKDDIKISLGENTIKFYLDNMIITTRYESNISSFPYEGHINTISKETNTQFTCNKKDILEVINNANDVSCDSRNCLIKLHLHDNVINISSKNGIDIFSKDVKGTMFTHEKDLDMLVGFNGKYLYQSIKNLNDNKVTISFTSNTLGGMLITGKNDVHMLLPVKISEYC